MAEEKMEQNSGPAEDREQDVRERFEQKIWECFERYNEEWMQKEPLDLVERSNEISAIRNLADGLSDILSQDEMEYLLRFKNPLEVAADVWCGSAFSEISGEEFSHALFDARDRLDLDESFELDNTAMEPTPQTSGLTMQT